MGNAPSGSKRRGSNEEEISINRDVLSLGQPIYSGNHSAKKKLIVQPTQDVYEIDAISKILSEADVSDIEAKFREAKLLESHSSVCSDGIDSETKTIPTVFKWEGGGKDVFLSGSFNHWKAKIPMVKSKHNFYTIVELSKGDHQYKFIVDGVWKIDHKQQVASNDSGSQNNVISVKSSDFDVLEALKDDIANSKNSSNNVRQGLSSNTPLNSPGRLSDSDKVKDGENENPLQTSSPPGSYSQELPQKSLLSEISNEKSPTPPLLPPHLLQVILNKETGVHCDPNLLPQPNHVMINHMYALSIKDGVIVLSAIARYRQKFVSTVMYKPI